ncbi:MAG: hypothetical protein V9F04_01140 [Dermatophilaceae bacterium]
MLIGWIGADAMALILLIVAGAGLWHDVPRALEPRRGAGTRGGPSLGRSRAPFLRVFNSALVVSGVAAVLAGVVFAGLFFYLPHLEDAGFAAPARRRRW